jgi:hypothetical protein
MDDKNTRLEIGDRIHGVSLWDWFSQVGYIILLRHGKGILEHEFSTTEHSIHLQFDQATISIHHSIAGNPTSSHAIWKWKTQGHILRKD